MVESLVHRLKHDFERISTEAGMQIDGSDEHLANALASIV
jgi:hypothetical protein